MKTTGMKGRSGDLGPKGFALLALGFRPFFLLAALGAVVFPALWVWAYRRGLPWSSYYGFVGWHAHEMLFGYTAAVIAGFLFTAVRNWTDRPTPTGVILAGFAGLWLVGRLLPFFDGYVPKIFIVVADMSFLPLVALAIAIPLTQRRQARNFVFVVLLLTMAFANGLVHWQALGMSSATGVAGVKLMTFSILLIIGIVAGRVIPFFSERALPELHVRSWEQVEALSIVSVVVLAAAELLYPRSVIAATAALAAAAIHGVRLYGWWSRRVWAVPLLSVLYLAYAWLIVGFVLWAGAANSWWSASIATHALAVGCVGTITLGMMARVALGHTGRPLRAAPSVATAFALINAAALVRVFPTLLWPQRSALWIVLSSVLWIAAFLAFALVYVPILWRPRADGRPG